MIKTESAKGAGRLRKILGCLRSPRFPIPSLDQPSHPAPIRHRQRPVFEPLEQRIMLSSLPTPFASVLVGAPALPGSSVYVAGDNQWQIAGAGTGITGASDQFNYTAESWTGSGSVQADVGALTNTSAAAQAGVMIRDTSAAGSSFAAVVENGNGGITFEYRSATGANISAGSTVNPIGPAWVRLTESQSGNSESFTGQYSTDGVHWVALNATPVNITFSSAANLAGLAVTSGNASESATVSVNSFSATPVSLNNQDIGSPGVAGSSTYDPSTGNWTVNGGGSDIWNTSDQFNFTSQSFSGNEQIVAYIASQTDTASSAKAGVMFRDTLAANSMFADVVATPSNGVALQWRYWTGDTPDSVSVSGITTPVWVKLTRVGDAYSGFYSINGTTWTQIGSPVEMAFTGTTNYAGLAVCADNNASISTANFNNVSIATLPPPPAPWTVQDIGGPTYAGGSVYDSASGQWTQAGSGSDIWGTSDQFNYASQSWTGNGEIVARITYQPDTGNSAQAGVMFRDSNAANGMFADVVLTYAHGLYFQWRSADGASAQSSSAVTGLTLPVWVKVIRFGNAFSGYYSTNGANWTQVGTTETLAMPSAALTGMVVCANNNDYDGVAQFDNVTVSAMALPTGYTGQDIGGPAPAGMAAYDASSQTWTVSGSGNGIWGQSDQFNFVSESLTGDSTITALVSTQTDTNMSAKAGVMFRNSGSPGDMFADVVVTPGNGVAFQWRGTAGASVQSSVAVTGVAAPVWVRLQRQGDLFTAYYSTDGNTWTQIGSSETIGVGSTALAGLAVSSNAAGTLSTASFTNVKVVAAPALPTGFTNQDIGSPQFIGSASYSPSTATWAVIGGGGGIYGTSDQFNFASESFAGDGQIIAEVNSQTNSSASAKAGVMFRNSNNPGDIYADVVVTPGNGVYFQWRSIEGALAQSSASVAGIAAPVWVKLERVGENFSAFYSTDGTAWTQVGTTENIQMSGTALAGLAVTASNNGALSAAAFTNVTIGAGAVPSPVTGLAAAAGTNSVTLSWTDPNTPSTETNLIIERSTDGVNYYQIASVAAGSTSFIDEILQPSTGYYYRVLAANLGATSASDSTSITTNAAPSVLPTPWNTATLGAVAAGSASYNSGVFTATGAGAVAPNTYQYYYVGATSDSGQYVYQPLGSNGQITTQVNSQQATGSWAQGGLMVRSAGGTDAPFAGLFVTRYS